MTPENINRQLDRIHNSEKTTIRFYYERRTGILLAYLFIKTNHPSIVNFQCWERYDVTHFPLYNNSLDNCLITIEEWEDILKCTDDIIKGKCEILENLAEISNEYSRSN